MGVHASKKKYLMYLATRELVELKEFGGFAVASKAHFLPQPECNRSPNTHPYSTPPSRIYSRNYVSLAAYSSLFQVLIIPPLHRPHFSFLRVPRIA